jgi:hypothetical protein
MFVEQAVDRTVRPSTSLIVQLHVRPWFFPVLVRVAPDRIQVGDEALETAAVTELRGGVHRRSVNSSTTLRT